MFKPYVGLGLGFKGTSNLNYNLSDQIDEGMAWELECGIEVHLTDKVILDASYTYIDWVSNSQGILSLNAGYWFGSILVMPGLKKVFEKEESGLRILTEKGREHLQNYTA